MADPSPSAAELLSLLSNSHITDAHSPGSIFDGRTVEDIHKEALEAAAAEHKRVRDTAIRVFRLHELNEAQNRIHQQTLLEEERVRAETKKAQDEIRLRELQATKIQQPPPRAKTPPSAPAPPPTTQPQPASSSTIPATQSQPAVSSTTPAHPPPVTTRSAAEAPRPQPPQQAPVAQPIPSQPNQPNSSQLIGQPTQAPTAPAVQQPVQKIQPKTQPIPAPTVAADQLPSHVFPTVDRYLVIHQFLKQIRKHMADEGMKNKVFKKKMGEMRREIRKSVGQLTDGKGANKAPVQNIVQTLKDALTTFPSPPVDPGLVMVSKPQQPIEGATNNGNSLPILFIYLLNIFSKSIVSQFADEAGVSPKAADPIGVVAVSIFSKPELLWRGQSLIDILMAKMRVVCPVLFGLRGSEKTEEGRARLGWRKNGGHWIQDQEHNVRMTGLGAGYAALSLRDYSKTKLTNPYPPVNYWRTMACIVSTPPEQASPTQYMVLKALIDGYEQRFMNFYGHAALAALKVALVDFPDRALENSVAVSSLKVLADKLKRDMGLQLDTYVPTSGFR